MPETFWTFERLGILDEMRRIGFTRKNGVQFVNHNDKESQPFFFDQHDPRDCSTTFHVQRADFDKLMFETAARRGAECRDRTRVLDVTLNLESPHVVWLRNDGGGEREVRARVVVDATGQQALLANKLNLRIVDPHLKKAAIWTYFDGAQRNGLPRPEVTCVLHTKSKDAWFWYIPLSDNTVSVGVVADNDFLLKGRGTPQATFQQELENCPGVGRRIAGSRQVGRYHVAKEFTYATREHAGPGWVLVGDAFGFIDPIYSSGVFLALKSGELAADAIIDGLSRNDISARQLSRWCDDFTAGVAWIRKLVDAFYTKEFSFGAFMREHPHLAGSLTDLLVGRVFAGNPGKLFEELDPWIDRLKRELAGGRLPSENYCSTG
jgi:flavin-dependent dehydrogenase